jgi:tripartite motif-containing protein 71
MTVRPDGAVLIADTGKSRILFLDSAGAVTGELGQLGEGPGELNEPTDVLVDPDGILYILEAYNHRLQKMDQWGGSLGSWAIPAAVAYDGPHGAWAPDGSLLITSPEEGAILRYSTQGQLLNRWTQAGAAPMERPVGIYLDSQGTLFVTDTAANYIYVFSVKPPS